MKKSRDIAKVTRVKIKNGKKRKEEKIIIKNSYKIISKYEHGMNIEGICMHGI